MARTPTPTFYKATQSIGGEFFGFLEGGIYGFFNGEPDDIPGLVPGSFERVPSADGRDVARVDVAALRERIAKSAIPPPVDPPYTRAELLKRFGWSEAQLELARRCGLPKPERLHRMRFVRGVVIEEMWRRDHVDAWADAIAALGIR